MDLTDVLIWDRIFLNSVVEVDPVLPLNLARGGDPQLQTPLKSFVKIDTS